VAAANKCANNGAKVINLSLGGPGVITTEKNAFANLLSKGIVSVAAAGNDGNTVLSYPASYPSVISVAAVDQNKKWASFSQYNAGVDLAAPGVQVYSAVPMGTARTSRVNVGDTAYPSRPMDGSPTKAAKARLFDFGLGDKVRAGASGKICLIKRGTIEFRVKVKNCEKSGGIGAIVYNNVSGSFQGTLGTRVTAIPSVSVSDSVGLVLKSQIGSIANVAVKTMNYDYFTGTSMATPHVSAVAALVWSYYPACSATQIRNALFKTTLDLGTGGRDNKTGYGLVQAKAAYSYLRNGCNG
jgi:subtilisin family serine protease